jgi:hypothetical protein
LTLRGKARAGLLKKEKSFGEAADQFEKEYEVITEGQRSAQWTESHKARIRIHLRPFFGKLGLSEVTPGKVQEYRVHRMTVNPQAHPPESKSKRKPKTTPPARSTLHDEIVTLRLVLKTAIRHGWLAHLPDLSPPYRSQGKIVHRPWFSPAEYKQLFTATRDYTKSALERFRWNAEQVHDYVLFGGVEKERFNRRRAPIAAAIFLATILAMTFKLLSLPVAALSGAFLMLVARCVSPEEAYRQVEWKVLILIGALLSLGAAMETSGAGKYLAQQLIGVIGQGHYGLLTSFFVLTVALTQPMSNQAAALVVFPIAMQTAIELGVNPRAFGMMVAVAASCSYLTPLEPSCLMVYGPGKYQFADFFKVGLPLTVLIYLISIALVPMVWPL